jgi:hypothetical protein
VVVGPAARLDGRHDDHTRLAIEEDQRTPVPDSQPPLAPLSGQSPNVSARQTFNRSDDALSFVARQPA